VAKKKMQLAKWRNAMSLMAMAAMWRISWRNRRNIGKWQRLISMCNQWPSMAAANPVWRNNVAKMNAASVNESGYQCKLI